LVFSFPLSIAKRLDAEYRIMRLQDHSSFFRPVEFEAITAAYNAALQHLRTSRSTLTSDQVQVLKKNLAQII